MFAVLFLSLLSAASMTIDIVDNKILVCINHCCVIQELGAVEKLKSVEAVEKALVDKGCLFMEAGK